VKNFQVTTAKKHARIDKLNGIRRIKRQLTSLDIFFLSSPKNRDNNITGEEE